MTATNTLGKKWENNPRNSTTAQNFGSRHSYRADDLEKIAEALRYRVGNS